MRILWRLFLQRFKKVGYSIPLVCIGVLFALFKWLFRGLFESFVFDKILKTTFGDSTGQYGGGGVVGNYVIDHPESIFYLLLGIAIFTILFLMYFDARKEFGSDYLVDTLNSMHKRMLSFVTLPRS